MKIKLEIEKDGELKKINFSTGRMRGRALKRMLEVQDVLDSAAENNSFTNDHYSLMCEYICEMFNNQFTTDELLDGADLEEIYEIFMELGKEIGNKALSKVQSVTKK